MKPLISRWTHSKDDLYLALLNYRNTPIYNGMGSPAQMLLNRNLRTTLPCISKFLNTDSDNGNRMLLDARQQKSVKCYDRNVKAERPKMLPGDVIKYRDSLADKCFTCFTALSTCPFD